MFLCSMLVLFNLANDEAAPSVALNLNVNLAPTWNYEYPVKPVYRSADNRPDIVILDDIKSNKDGSDDEEINDDNINTQITESDIDVWKNSDDDETRIRTDTSSKEFASTKALIGTNYHSSESEDIEEIKPVSAIDHSYKHRKELLYRVEPSHLDDERLINDRIGKRKLRTGHNKKRSELISDSERFKKQNSKVKKKRDRKRSGKFKRVRGGYEIKLDSDDDTVHYNILDRTHSYRNIIKDINQQTARRDPRLKKIFVKLYNSSLTTFYDLRNKVDDTDLKDFIDDVIESFKNEFKDHIKNSKVVVKDTDKVIFVLETIELVKKFTDDFIELMIIKATETSPSLRIDAVVHEAFGKLFDEKYDYICEDFNVCRRRPTFRGFFDNFLNIIIKSEHAKMTTISNTFLNIFGTKSEILGPLELIKSLNALPLDERYFALTELWLNVKRKMKDDNELFPLPVPDGSYVMVLTPAFDVIPATSRNVLLWKKLTVNLGAFVNDNFPDGVTTFLKLKWHLYEHGKNIYMQHNALELNSTEDIQLSNFLNHI